MKRWPIWMLGGRRAGGRRRYHHFVREHGTGSDLAGRDHFHDTDHRLRIAAALSPGHPFPRVDPSAWWHGSI